MTIALHSCPYQDHFDVVVEHRWGQYDIWRVPRWPGPTRSHFTNAARRAPARGCRMQRQQWKRRRYIHSLRRTRC